MKKAIQMIALLFLCNTAYLTHGALQKMDRTFKDSFAAFPDKKNQIELDISGQVAKLQNIDVDHAFSNRASLLKTMYEAINRYKEREKEVSSTFKDQYDTFSNALLEMSKEEELSSATCEKLKKIKKETVLSFDQYQNKSQELMQTLNTQLTNKVAMLCNIHEQDAASLSQEITQKGTQVKEQVVSSIQAKKQGLAQKTKGLSQLKQRCLTTLEIQKELEKRNIKCYREINEAKINEQKEREERALKQEIKDAKQQLELKKITQATILEDEIECRRARLKEKKRAEMEELSTIKLLMQQELQSKRIAAQITLEEELSSAYGQINMTHGLFGIGLERKIDQDLRELESQHTQKLHEIYGHIQRFEQYQKAYTNLLMKIGQGPMLVLETEGRPPKYILSSDATYIERVDRGELPTYRRIAILEKILGSF